MKLSPTLKMILAVENRNVLLKQAAEFCNSDKRICELSEAICSQIGGLLAGYKSSECALALQLIADATIASMMDDDLIRDTLEEL